MSSDLSKGEKVFRSFRAYFDVLLLSFGFFLLFIPQNFFCIAISDYLVDVGLETGRIMTISYGLFNIFGIVVVRLLTYKNSLLIGSVMLLPFYVACIISKGIVGAKLVSQNVFAVKMLMYPTGVLNGIGQSILWIAQGCYVSGICTNETVSRAFSIFNLLFNLTGFVGSAIMLLFGTVDNYGGQITSRKDLITLVALSFPSIIGIVLFVFLKPLHIDSKELESITRNWRKAFRAVLSTIPLMPAMAFTGVVIAFVGIGMNRPYSNGTEYHRYLGMMNNGLFTVIGSIFCTAFLTPSRLEIFTATSLVGHVGALILYGLNVEYMQIGSKKHLILQPFYALLGFANALFITCIYALISIRYECCVSIAMWIFMCLNGIAGGLLSLQLNCKEWTMLLGVMAFPSYLGMLGELYRMKKYS